LIKNALIFVGGFGTRLGSITKRTPKPLIKFNKQPFIEYIIKEIIKFQVKKIILLCHYKYKMFYRNYHNKKFNNIKIKCIKENQPLGTAGSLFKAKRFINGKTIVCNGDTFIKANYKEIRYLKLNKKIMFMYLVKNSTYKSNKILNDLTIKNTIVKNNTQIKRIKYMNAGFYIIDKKIIKYLKNKNSLENEVLPELIKRQLIIGKIYKKTFLDIGTKKNLKKFNFLIRYKKV
jgi:NDP-sugar pyrophosphorylase family protein